MKPDNSPFTLAARSCLVCSAVRELKPAPSLREHWKRTNYRGREVNLSGGVKMAACLGANFLLGSSNLKTARVLPVGIAAAVGYLDDTQGELMPPASRGAKRAEKLTCRLCLDPRAKGFKGHLGALKRGEITTGVLKIAGIGLGALVGGGIIAAAQTRSKLGFLATWTQNTVLIAASANLLNLLDLRPGRALKVAQGASSIVALGNAKVRAQALSLAVSAAAALPADLEEKEMLGDTGANALGAALGVILAEGFNFKSKLVLNAALVSLTVASEKISFSRVIEQNRILNYVDQLGRRA